MWRAHTSSLRSATPPLLTRGCGFGQRGACTVKCAKRRCQQRRNAPHPEARGVKGACGIRPEPHLRAREFPSAGTGSAQTRDRATRAGPKPLPHTLAPSHPEGHTNAKSMKNMHRTNSDMHMQASAPSAARAWHRGEVDRPARTAENCAAAPPRRREASADGTKRALHAKPPTSNRQAARVAARQGRRCTAYPPGSAPRTQSRCPTGLPRAGSATTTRLAIRHRIKQLHRVRLRWRPPSSKEKLERGHRMPSKPSRRLKP